ncbi:MAG: Mur ligase family protein [Patescibacteria group bacterium]|nr:Mur ligase family protein [Patescibacteria group bacterium]
MSFAEAYNYILSLSNMPRMEYMKEGNMCDWYLKRLQFFLDLLGNPEKKIKHYIHVTGTSGKGSTVSFLHNILQASNKRVASTYSPHPTVITERWKVGNKFMTKKEFVEIVEYLKPKLDEYLEKTPYDMLSFFELTEVIGFIYFAKKKVDWLVLEVACGGRYDSSNIIPYKDVAVITNIGLDHVGIIGNNKEEIAYEKAGIIKQNCTAFTTEQDKKILNIIEKEADKEKVNLHKLKINNYKIKKEKIDSVIFEYEDVDFEIKALGPHQIKNAILCINVAKFLKIKISNIQQGLKQTQQPLRFEIVQEKPYIILDGAHNEDKIKSTVEAMKKIKTNKLYIITGFSGDKKVNNMIKSLSTLNPTFVCATKNTNNHFRKVADPKIIAKEFTKNKNTKTKIFLDPQDALEFCLAKMKKNDALLITGSIFLSGQLREKFRKI